MSTILGEESAPANAKVQSRGVAFVNGAYLPADQPLISVFDHGFLYGDGVFDTWSAKYGYIFKFDAHLARFFRSLRAIGLDIPYTPEQVREVVLETLRRNGLEESAYIKIVATRGVSAEPVLEPRGCTPTLVVFARPYLHWAPAAVRETGLSVKLASTRRVAVDAIDTRAKTLNYLNLVLARLEAIAASCDEALLLDEDGYICEGPGYNVFVVANGVVITPEKSILHGVTRETVLEICGEMGIPAEIRSVSTFDLYTADEAFLTGTAGGLVPVTRADGRVIGTGARGPVTSQIDQAYDEMLRSGRHGTPISSAT